MPDGGRPASVAVAEPAGLITRLMAGAVDAVVLAAMFFSIHFGLIALGKVMVVAPRFVFTLADWIRWTAQALLVPAYHVLCWTFTGKTPGKWLLGVRLVTRRGGSIHFGRALLRFALLTLSIAPLLAGVVFILFDRKRRAWHDRLAGTLVIYDRAPEPPHVRLRLARAAS